jgi:hypothetical protein
MVWEVAAGAAAFAGPRHRRTAGSRKVTLDRITSLDLKRPICSPKQGWSTISLHYKATLL